MRLLLLKRTTEVLTKFVPFTVNANAVSPAFLLFGGGRAGRPRYDLSGRLPAPGERLRGSDAAMAAYLHDASHVALAHRR